MSTNKEVILQSQGFFERVCEALGIPNVYGAKTKVAKIAGISSNAVGLWEAGQMPGRNTLEPIARIAEQSNTSIHWLLTGEGEKSLASKTLNFDSALRDLVREIVREEIRGEVEKYSKTLTFQIGKETETNIKKEKKIAQ